jgi:tetratricopeptide (TPR) repeat protein
MTLISRASLALSLAATPLAALPVAAFLSAPVMAQALSPAVGKPLQQASAAARAGNIAAATNAVNQARAAATTPTERRKVSEMAAFVYTRGGNYAKAAAELEAIGAPASQLAPLYYQARMYDKAIATAKRSGQTTIVAQSLLMQGKAAEAAKIYEQLVARNPSNLGYLTNLAGAQFKMGDRKAYLATTTKLVRLDPSPARWKALLVDMKGGTMSREAKLALYHLMLQTGNLTSAADVQDFAKIAIVAGQPGVAQTVVQQASASGVLPAGDAMTAKLTQAAGKRQEAALAQAPAQDGNPAAAFAAGNAFLGANMYPQAIQAYTVGQKGPNAADSALFKGIAQLRAGNAAAARTTFASVSTGPLADIAALWSLYASTRR